jgi:hypothetical protein
MPEKQPTNGLFFADELVASFVQIGDENPQFCAARLSAQPRHSTGLALGAILVAESKERPFGRPGGAKPCKDFRRTHDTLYRTRRVTVTSQIAEEAWAGRHFDQANRPSKVELQGFQNLTGWPVQVVATVSRTLL